MFNKYIIKEKSLYSPKKSKRENNILILNPGEKYNKIYSNFEVKKGPFDYWEGIDKKIKVPSNTLDIFYHKLGFKNYEIINNEDMLNNKSYIQSKNKLIYRNKNENKIKKSLSFNYQIKNKKIKKGNKNNNNIFERLYNYGFYIKNKIIIKRIKNEENLSKTMAKSKLNSCSKKYLNNKINKKRLEKTYNYYLEEESFKPKINKNSIKLFNRLKKNKKQINKENKRNLNLSFTFNDIKENIPEINISNYYLNLINFRCP